MDEEATQQSTQDRLMPLETSFAGDSEEDALAILVGSVGMYTRWLLVPKDATDAGRVWTFGRNANSDFQLDVGRKRLSNTHFKIWATQDSPPTLMLTDCSTNGTFLNNVRMSKGKNCMLVNGDVISVGVGVPEDEVKFIVSVPKKDGAPAPVTGINAVYEFGAMLGQGAFAHVRLAIKRETGEKLAVKIIQKSKISVGIAVKREIEVLRAVQNPYIVCLRDFYEDNNYYYLVMDYVPGGDLMDYVQVHGFIEEEPGREILRQVLMAIHHVHRMGISHRDLKPDNILIAQDNPVVVKIADFGLAKISNQGTFLKTFCGTLSYLAPEVLASRNSNNKSTNKGYSQLVDIWSVGCVAYVILTGYMPFNGSTQEELYRSVQSGKFNLEPLKAVGLSENGVDFIRTLLEVDVAKRPTAAQALHHPWMLEGNPEESDVLSIPGASAPVKQEYDLKGMSSLNLLSSQMHPRSDDIEPVPAPHAVQQSFPAPDAKIEDSYPPPNNGAPSPIKGSMPSLAYHEDSDPDSYDAQRHANEIAASQVENGAGSAAGVRDFDDVDAMATIDPKPDGSWLKLATQPDSVPFKDIYISNDQFVVGRDIENVDLEIKDTRLSKLHCRLRRVKNSQGLWEVWFDDFSTNGCYINGTQGVKNHTTQVFDKDSLWLYLVLDAKDPNKYVVLGFDLVLLDGKSYAVTRTKEPHFDPLDASLIPVPPQVANARVEASVIGRKRSQRSLSLGKHKRHVPAT